MELWFSEFHAPDVKHSIRVNRHLYSHKSPYQQIDIYETPEFGKVLSLDGNVMLTERDEFIYDEMITHVPMAVHPGIKNVLVIGAGDGGVVHELARYRTIENIDLVEMDEQVVEACRMYLPENASRLDDERVHIYFDNALRFIRRRTDEYDLIIVDSTDPFGPSESYFTKEFYGICYNALHPGQSAGKPVLSARCRSDAAQPPADRQYISNQQSVSGTHPDLCGRILALWFRKQKISSAG